MRPLQDPGSARGVPPGGRPPLGGIGTKRQQLNDYPPSRQLGARAPSRADLKGARASAAGLRVGRQGACTTRCVCGFAPFCLPSNRCVLLAQARSRTCMPAVLVVHSPFTLRSYDACHCNHSCHILLGDVATKTSSLLGFKDTGAGLRQ